MFSMKNLRSLKWNSVRAQRSNVTNFLNAVWQRRKKTKDFIFLSLKYIAAIHQIVFEVEIFPLFFFSAVIYSKIFSENILAF